MRYNIIFVGSVGAGKTSIIRKYFPNGDDKVVSTIAIDFVPTTIGDIDLSIWDTCGQERFNSITSSYFMRGHVFVLVHDISDSTVTKDLQRWHDDIVRKKPARHTPRIIVVSNKTDKQPFCSDSVKKWVGSHSFDHVYTSATVGEGVQTLFQKIHDAVLVHQSEWLTPSLPALPSSSPSRAAPGCMCG